MIKKKDTFNLETTYAYDPFNNSPSQICHPPLYTQNGESAVIETFAYEPVGRCILSSNPRQNSKQTSYNAYGSPIEIIYSDQGTESFRYTKSGLLQKHTNLSGITTYYAYDALGRIISKNYEFDQKFLEKETFEYQGTKLIKWTNKEKRVTEYAYDGAGRKIREVIAGRESLFSYDSLGRFEKLHEENGQASLVTCYEYDNLDQITGKICKDFSGNVLTEIHYTYDTEGNVETIKNNINGNEAVKTFAHDSQNRVICFQDALGNTTTTSYDEGYFNSHGQQVLQKRVTLPNKVVKLETFDPYGRIAKKEIVSPEGATVSSEENCYDVCGNLSLHRQNVYEGNQFIKTKLTAYEYDSEDRQTSFTRAFQTPQERNTSYSYYPDGQVKTKTKPDGIVLSYIYDPFGNIK